MSIEKAADSPKRLALVASKGSLDQAMPPLILAMTAASMGWEAGIFFTFYGLDIIQKKKAGKLKVPAIANPAMPIPIPTLIGILPGMSAMATWMMGRWMKRANVPDSREMIAMCQGLGVKFFACSTSMGVMGVSDSDLIEGCEIAGAAAFLDFAGDADIQLFV